MPSHLNKTESIHYAKCFPNKCFCVEWQRAWRIFFRKYIVLKSFERMNSEDQKKQDYSGACASCWKKASSTAPVVNVSPLTDNTWEQEESFLWFIWGCLQQEITGNYPSALDFRLRKTSFQQVIRFGLLKTRTHTWNHSRAHTHTKTDAPAHTRTCT